MEPPRKVGKYRIDEKLGQGAMGEVFRGYDPVLERPVAIKIIAGRLSQDEKIRNRFLREAKAAAQLNHPNIITVYDFSEEDGQPWMAMELLEGHDLRELVGVGTLADKLGIMEQILDGLAFAHAKGVVHRDLKPGNVRVLPNRQVKIMDFGLARRTEDGAATGIVMGTPYYMAPEHAQGEHYTARADLFSVGAMFYEMLAGKRPFIGRTIPAVLYAVVHKDPTPLAELVPDLPPGIATVVMRALAKEPEQRYADAGEMLEALRAAGAGRPMEDALGGDRTADLAPARDLGPPLSAHPDLPADLRAALAEVDQFLDDRVPPLMAAESVAMLAEAPIDPAAAEIMVWAARQQDAQPDLPAVDLFFHALHKLSVIGEFNLVDNEMLIAFLRAAGAALADACPPGPDRDRFRRALVHLGESEMIRTGPSEMLRFRSGEPETGLLTPPPTASPALRRLSVLEQRLRRESALRGATADAARRRIGSQAIAAAAVDARSEKELESHLRRLRAVGVASGAEQVFRNLGHELANWVIPAPVYDTAELGPAAEVQAMKKIVSLPEDPIEVARRYRHLVSAATEQFNEGNLGRAVQMFELATKLGAEKKVDPGLMEATHRKGHEALDVARLRQYVDNPDRHEQLQAVMKLFEAGLGPAPLLDQLETESRRDRRRLLLALLVVHGEGGRAMARGRLLASLKAPASNFSRRNWISLLRLVPRTGGESAEEIAAVSRFAAPGNPTFLVREALTYLAQVRHPRATDELVSLLGAWEEELDNEAVDPQAQHEGQSVLDRLAGALARNGEPKGWRALVVHGLSRRARLGTTVARLADLGTQDLSSSPEVVKTLVGEIQGGLPRGVLGRLVGRKTHDLPAVVAALAGTRTPAVTALLEEVKKRYAGQDLGKAAARALEAPPPTTPAAPSGALSGELEPGSLPALLHRLALGRASGSLNLLPREGGGPPASILFSQGRPVGARWAHRTGEEAVYHLFERAFPGGYAFESSNPTVAGTFPDLSALVVEGVRRTRELQRTSALVPEDLPLEATGTPPGTVIDEQDYDLVVALWAKACAGVSVRQLETELTADAFRIHRPLAQWLEEGALRIVAPPAGGEPPAATPTPA